ncbi:MAG TPA: glycoside hydrolase family 97 protein [Puia sp.]|jgi:alpha-glucosidase|nr:glycoside hydrolase family 97 protein [Puia sp.]
MKCLLFLFLSPHLTVSSPSGHLTLEVWQDKEIKYRIYEGPHLILDTSSIDLIPLGAPALSHDNPIRTHTTRQVAEEITSPVPEKRIHIPDHYNALTLSFRQPYRLEFRVYDDAVAYRIITLFKDTLTIQKEVARFHFPGNPSAWFPGITKRPDADIYHTSFEELYPLRKLDSIASGEIAYSPVLVTGISDLAAGSSAPGITPPAPGPRIALTESDLEDYPGMFIAGTGTPTLTGDFAPYPLEEKLMPGEYPEAIVTRRANYIARTKGNRTLPWRVLIIADQDKDLPSNDVVYRLASPSRVADPSWIHPGKGTDEWTIDVNLFNVPFRSGVNTASYKYYIDFAKRFGFSRIMMDAGWSDVKDLFKINPAIDMDTLVAYARNAGIKISMWTLSHTLNRQLDSALTQFNKWGVDYIMTDFIDRDDQPTVNFYHIIARACALHHIMIMYHGAFPPKGFNRTWPNAVSREGVLGSEYNIWSDKATPPHDVTLPFTRMLAGSFDYEPGILNNATQKGFRPIPGMVMSQGTRCHQLAMFVVYDNPMQIFSGNPSQGMQEPAFMELLGSIPTTWDDTRILDGKVSEYILTARKKKDSWFIGGMTNWSARDLTLPLDFLASPDFAPGTYKATICQDGVNADRYAADYTLIKDIFVKSSDTLHLHLAPGGGIVIRLEKNR